MRRTGGPGYGIDQRSVAWTRQKLFLTLGASAVVALVLLIGLVLAVISWLRPGTPADPNAASQASAGQSPGGTGSGRGQLGQPPAPSSTFLGSGAQAAKDALAARPMTDAPLGSFTPSALSTRLPDQPITLPAGASADHLGVRTGFPRTRQGALAQLAAIDQVAFGSGSLPGLRAVIKEWAVPGGPDGTTWSGVRAMTDLLGSAGLPGTGSADLTITLTPSMGQLKGSVGTDYAVVCIDFVLEVSMRLQASRVAVSDCERMEWSAGRWKIGAGAEPYQTTPVWPGTDAAIDAGWKDLVHG